jgi:hypothetical protein
MSNTFNERAIGWIFTSERRGDVKNSALQGFTVKYSTGGRQTGFSRCRFYEIPNEH